MISDQEHFQAWKNWTDGLNEINERISSLERKVDAIVKFCMESVEGPHSARNQLEEDLNDR